MEIILYFFSFSIELNLLLIIYLINRFLKACERIIICFLIFFNLIIKSFNNILKIS